MPESLSLYLDLVRFLATVAVLLFHLWPQWFPGFPLPWPGHAAVIVFFVLSGFVIAHAYAERLKAQQDGLAAIAAAAGFTFGVHRTDHAPETALLALYTALAPA